MRTRFVAYNRLGARRGVLTHIMQAEIVPSKNELPTLTLTYPRSTPTHKWLLDSPEVGFEYWHPVQQNWVEPKNARFKLVTQDFDYLEEVETRNYSFIGIGEAIKGIYVFDGNGLNVTEEGKVQFVASTPGKMMSHVWDYAIQRGWKGLSRSFSATTDSSGKAWKTSMNLSFDRDTSLDSMLNYFSRMGLIDFEWEGRTLHVYNADTTMARDLSTGTNPTRFNLSGGRASVDAAPESNDHENLASHVIVYGENGLRWIFPTNAVVPEGRREVFLSYSGVDDEGTAQILAAPTIAKYSNSLKNTTRQFQISESTKLFPYIHYGIGDWVLVEKDGGVWERVQIFQLALLINQNGVQGYISLGDKIDSLLEKLNEAVQRVQGGSVNEGTEPPAKSSVEPTAPKGLLVSSSVLADTFGQLQTLIALNFTHDGKAVDGRQVNVNRYEVQYRPDGGVWSHLFMVQPPSQSGTYSWLPAKKANGEPAIYEFQVYAVSDKAQWSKGSNIVKHTVTQDGVAPSQPQPPKVKGEFGVFTATTAHLKANGTKLEADYNFMVIQVATSAAGPWTDATTIVPPVVDGYISAGGYFTRWFRAVAVDIEGNRSTPSTTVTAETKPLVDTDLIIKELDAAKTIIKNGEKILIETGVELGQHLSDAAEDFERTELLLTGPGGLTERLDDAEETLVETRATVTAANIELNRKLTETNTSLTTARTQLDTLRNTTLPGITTQLGNAEKLIASNNTALTNKLTAATDSIALANGEITKVRDRVSPLETGINTMKNTTIPGLVNSINGKSEIIRSTSIASLPTNYRVGDRWEKWSSLGVGGKLTQTWRHNGSAWIEEILDASYLPLVDIGAGTFGSLNGGRLISKSVHADTLLVGMGENLLMDPSFEDETISRMRAGTNANWSWVKDTLGGSYMTATADSGDMQLGNASGAEMFIIDPKGALAFTAEFSGPDPQVYLQVKYADGTTNTGPYLQTLTSETKGTGKRTATVQWNLANASLSASGSPPVSARPILRARPGGTQKIFSVRFAPATKGELIVNGTITGDHVDAQSVGAKVGTFVQINVDQIDVTGNANFKTAVADKLFVNMFATNKLTTNELLVGKGENLIPWAVNNPPDSRTVLPHVGYGGTLSIDGTNGLVEGHVLINNQVLTAGTFTSVIQLRPATKANNLPTGVFPVLPSTKYKISVWVRAGGTYGTYPNIRLNVGTYDAAGAYHSGPYTSVPKVITWSWQEIVIEVETKPEISGLAIWVQQDQRGVLRLDQPSLVKDGASLIATGGIVADHITASKEMSAKIGTFLELSVDKLTATGTTNLNEVVANRMFASIFATNRLTANQILIGEGGNILADPNFIDPDGWNNPTYITKGAGRNGNNGIIFPSMASTQQGAYYGSADRNRQFAVIPGASYKISVWVKADAAVPINGVAMYMKWSTPSSAASGSFSSPNNITNKDALRAGVWTEITGIVTVGDTAVKGFIGVFSQTITTTRVIFSEPSVVSAIDQGLIVENGILAKHITASEEMSAKIGTFLELNVTQLVATGTSKLKEAVIENLWTNVVRSRSITTDMLLVGKGANLIPNGDLANGKEGWSPNFGIYNGDPSALKEGYPASIWLEGRQTRGSTESFSVKAGAVYQFSVHVRANTAGKRFYIQLVTDEASADNLYLLQNQESTTSLKKFTTEFEVPASATGAKLNIYANHQNGTTTDGHQWFTGFELYEKNAASLIVAGGIVTKQLKITEEMTAALLKAKKVEATEINFNSLFGDSGFIGDLRTTVLRTNSITSDLISAAAITSKHTLTGPLYQTTSAADRGIKINSAGLRAFDANGELTFNINGANGQVTATGQFIATTTADNSYVSMYGSTSGVGGSTRPRILWHTADTSLAFQPSAFVVTKNEGGFAKSSLSINGAELNANSSGRAALVLGPHDKFNLSTAFGNHSGTGIYVDAGDISIIGKLSNKLGALFTVHSFAYGAYNAAAGGQITWKPSFIYPSGSGVKVHATADTDIMACATTAAVSAGGCTVTVWFPAAGRASGVTAQLMVVRV